MANIAKERVFNRRNTRATSWSIADFKSIEYAKVSLNPQQITILTGMNSIGKSSLVQSILMLCQSINSYGDNLVLNGTLTKLGIPKDIVRDGKKGCRIGLDYALSDWHTDEIKLTVNTSISLTPSTTGNKQSDISKLSLSEICLSLSNSESFLIQSSGLNNNDINACMSLLERYGGSNISILKASTSSSRLLVRTYIAFRGLQPIAIVKLRTKHASYSMHKTNIKKIIESGFRYSSHDDIFYFDTIAQELTKESKQSSDLPTHILPRRNIKKLSAQIERMSNEELEMLIDKVANSFAEKKQHTIKFINRYDIDEFKGENDALDLLAAALHALDAAIADIAFRVKYIGPLRDDPRVISPLAEESGNNLPIGIKGERAAAALLSNFDKDDYFGFPDTFEIRKTSLGEAIDAWSQYLGVASAVHAASKQKLGISINVSADGTERDLTQVGVGASQAIPILVGLLNADKEAIVIIEQPELHLHPSAQAKLADFLLFARPDISVLIETHSEALVTRLRRRVAENENLANRINIQFFEKECIAGGVICHELKINEYGNLNNWPKGFMDAVQEDSRIIMKTALNKRKEKRNRNEI